MNFFRQIVAPIILFTFIVRSGGDYLDIWWSIFGIVWFSAIFSVSYGVYVLRGLKK